MTRRVAARQPGKDPRRRLRRRRAGAVSNRRTHIARAGPDQY